MLLQLMRSACSRHSGIRLRRNGREYGRSVHQASSNTEASAIHGGDRAAPLLKKLLGSIHFIWVVFISFWFYSFHLGSLTFTVWAGRPSKGYGNTFSPVKQSLSGVLMRPLIISLFHYSIVFIYMYLPTDCRKRRKCCIVCACARKWWCTQVLGIPSIYDGPRLAWIEKN